MNNEQVVENEIQEKGLTAPRITPEHIDNTISSEDYHVFEGSQLTVCCLTLRNGFTVTGESACASPENFDAEIGRKIAFRNARDKVWPLEGYLLKDRLHHMEISKPGLDDLEDEVVHEAEPETEGTDNAEPAVAGAGDSGDAEPEVATEVSNAETES